IVYFFFQAEDGIRDRNVTGVQTCALPMMLKEKVLEVGCGRGLVLNAAAQRLTTGKAVGIDLWNERDQSGNHPDATRKNAAIEGVAEKVEIITGDARHIPFANNTFDVVVSSLAIHNIYI